ncbi:transglutaminase domain-containing protein [Ichthyenterobacterium sp. W332]|uniref:Transglutaminase domain-containing protein n=1 Tax=Microcosmobacter mediterraneus TaxID=3075607 RepID=A0ABU2YL34_9FLAO|nr:transglutaminase domain-containing protein [Ichthyenterobacterium sp. W332]MDT0558527.1 transglutaminase domain-containing protein [Ichthyenterobacterium sp. W332]
MASVYKNETLTNLPELTYKLTSQLSTDVERFRAIYKWVCLNIANDYGLYYRNKRKRYRYKNDSLKLNAWNSRFKKRLFKKLLKDKKTICTGYAYLVRELSKLANLECQIIHGFGKTSTIEINEDDSPNHSWNAIKLNNTWYLCDPTWSSGIPNLETGAFTFYYNDGYFLANPELFSVNHFPEEQKWQLTDSTLTFKSFLESPILYGNTYRYLKNINTPKVMHHIIKEEQSIMFKYTLRKLVNKQDVILLIDSGINSRKVSPTEVSIVHNYLTINHKFKTRGFYDVHLYLKDQLIITYTVKVIK